MPLLCNVQDLMADLGFDTMPNISNAVTAALQLAEVELSSALGTRFEQAQVIDKFFVREPTRHTDWSNCTTEFRLSHGFVNPEPPIDAVSEQKFGISFPDWTIIIGQQDTMDVTGDLILQAEKGVVVDNTNYYARSWVTFTYTSGFPLDPNNAASYDLTKVPYWLQKAAHLQARITLQSNPALEDPKIKLDTSLMQKQLNVMLASKMRYAPAAFLPDSTQAVLVANGATL